MWLFEWLLRLYPTGFRAEYGDSMRLSAREDLAESSWLAFAFRLLTDFALSWPAVVGAELRQDAIYCWRSWRKRTAVTAMAVLSLGMALGISTGVFSVLNAMLYRSLPFKEPDRLVQFEAYFAPHFKGVAGFIDWKKDHEFLSDAGVFTVNDYNLERKPSSIRVKGAETTANFFQLMGAPLFLGRSFAAGEDTPGKGGVVVLSHALYEQAFGGDARILGQTIHLNRQPLTVIGVAAPGFDFPQNATLWTPLAFDYEKIKKSGVSSTITVGRLVDGLTPEQAQAAFVTVAKRKPDPNFPKAMGEMKAKMLPLRDQLVGPVKRAIWVLFAGVCVVLLIACANLSHLLLSRFAERGDEFKIRSWLGAGSGRISQQILTECVLLALASCVVGLGFAELTARIGAHYFPPLFAFQRYEVLDFKVLLFAFGLALLCGFGFGMTPPFLN
ncbi:MAG: FtsX-like permease family protein [Acidobacteria bacterium]|nr:FtsX-like permease family protein [Acidobacteriota bacterium]